MYCIQQLLKILFDLQYNNYIIKYKIIVRFIDTLRYVAATAAQSRRVSRTYHNTLKLNHSWRFNTYTYGGNTYYKSIYSKIKKPFEKRFVNVDFYEVVKHSVACGFLKPIKFEIFYWQ